MAKILVNLISEQTIPNIRFIKEYHQAIEKFVFITTIDMEQSGKTNSHLKVFNIPDRKIQKIIVDPFKFKKIENILLETNFNEDDEYFVNITGGTKPMSIVAMSFFSGFKNAKMFYVPIGEENYRQVYPRIDQSEKLFSKHLTLKEYFESHNLELIGKENKASRDIEIAKKLMVKFIQNHGDIKQIPKIFNAKSLVKSIDKAYYSGGWFEEFIFWKIKQKFKLNENQIAYNVKLQNERSTNEYDAVFIYHDSIYIVECKAYFSLVKLKQKIEKDLYKLGALDKDFGLRSNAIYITTANIKANNIKENISLKERANSLKIQLFQFNDLINDKFLNEIK